MATISPLGSSLSHQQTTPRSVSILGATGSVGRQTLDMLSESGLPYRLHALTAGSDAVKLAELARHYKPVYAGLADESGYELLKSELSGTDIKPICGAEAEDIACRKIDWVMGAISGYRALPILLKAAANCRVLAVANKESLVCSGGLLTETAAASGCKILPVDSEHASVFRLLSGKTSEAIGATLTASGGAFRDLSLEELEHVTPRQALNHPVWKMGAKITIDSASMLNKGLEIIEAYSLFPYFMPGEVEAVIHREAYVHALVSWRDGTMTAHLGTSDMRFPAAQAWHYPHPIPAPPCRALRPSDLSTLHFEPVCPRKYPCYYLALDALKAGGMAPLTLAVAGEAAATAFLQGKMAFTGMAGFIADVLTHRGMAPLPSPEEIPLVAERLRFECELRLKPEWRRPMSLTLASSSCRPSS